MTRKLSKFNYQQGFSLLEILVAFAILAVFLGVLVNIFSTSVRGAQLTGEYARAIQIAESLLATAAAETPLEEDERYGIIDETYSWTILIERYLPVDDAWNEEISPFLPYQVKVEVDWGDKADKRTFSLLTLRLAEKGDTK